MGLTTDRSDACLNEIKPSGQQECYLVLSQDEIDKGFVRPVRASYVHVKCGAETTMALRIAETYARDPSFYSGTFCGNCGTHFSLVDYTDEPLDEEDKAAGRVLHKARQFKWSQPVASSEYVGQ